MLVIFSLYSLSPVSANFITPELFKSFGPLLQVIKANSKSKYNWKKKTMYPEIPWEVQVAFANYCSLAVDDLHGVYIRNVIYTPRSECLEVIG